MAGEFGMEHSHSSTQDKSIDEMQRDAIASYARGAKQWIPDFAGIPGDLLDALAYAGRKVAAGQSEKSIPSLGAGAALRRWAMGRMGNPQKRSGTGISATPEFDPREEATRFANPLFFTNPAKALPIVAGAMGGVPGGLGVIKQKGGNWLSGSIENALSGLKKTEPGIMYGVGGANAEAYRARNINLNNWIEGPLTKYVRNDMATPGDPVRALAERGVLHTAPDFRPGTRDMLIGRRAALGQKPMGEAITPLAQGWEGVADNAIGVTKGGNKYGDTFAPSTSISNFEDLGFNHLIDELSNSINPESGLPRHLQFPVDRLSKVTVPQAVERVAQINAWRAAQKAELDVQKANNAATHLHKEYPDDPRGMRWVELKTPVEQPNGPAGLEYMEAKKQLGDALKYEGDTMGNCVGGYCDDVASGKSKIYSLRDNKGQPHVTIEVSPERSYGSSHLNAQRPKAEAEALENGLGPDTSAYGSYIARRMDELAKESVPSRILQIKGSGKKDGGQKLRIKANGYDDEPDADLLPFVQDFVKSGQWSDVRDMHNTGLRYYKQGTNLLDPAAKEKLIIPQGYHSKEDIERIMIEGGVPDYNLGGWVRGEGFASGGLIQSKNVQTVQDLSVIINQLRNGITNNA